MRPAWIAPTYGYLVCVIAVITFLVNLSGFVDATFARANPLAARDIYFANYGGSLTSFESFRATYDQYNPGRPVREGAAPPDSLTEGQLRARYEALHADRITTVGFQSMQRMVKNGLLMLLAIALFATHWTWLRRRPAD